MLVCMQIGILVVLALTLRKRPESLLHKADVLRTSPQFQGQDKLPMLAWTYGQVRKFITVLELRLE